MKKRLLIVTLLLFSLFISAQDKYFINSDGDRVSQNDALYKRSVEKIDRSLYKVTDYFLDETVQMVGYYNSKKLVAEKDTFTWYHINGQVERQVSYNAKGRNGNYKEFYFNGNKGSVGQYLDGEKHGKWLKWNYDGVLLSEKDYNLGNPVNTWIWYDSTGTEKHKIIDVTENKLNNTYVSVKLKNGMTFPEYFGTVKCPDEVFEENIVGYTMIEFMVDTNGLVKDVDVIIRSDKRLTDAAINHIQNMPECSSSIYFGNKMEAHFTIPFNFIFSNEAYAITDSQKTNHFFNSGLKAVQAGKTNRALRRIKAALKFSPADVEINYLLGSLYYQISNIPKACKYWTLAYTLDPDKIDDTKKCICEIPNNIAPCSEDSE